jgi:hypothetical protein
MASEPALAIDMPNERKESRNIQRDFHGLPIVIEYLKGDNKPNGMWMYADYGFIKNTTANDGMDQDVFLGSNPDSENVYMYALYSEDGVFDEYKIMLGFDDEEQVTELVQMQYSQYPDSPRGPTQIIEMSLDDLKAWSRVQALKSQKDKAGADLTLQLDGPDSEDTFTSEGADERPLVLID